jgi:hypothetical protein
LTTLTQEQRFNTEAAADRLLHHPYAFHGNGTGRRRFSLTEGVPQVLNGRVLAAVDLPNPVLNSRGHNQDDKWVRSEWTFTDADGLGFSSKLVYAY